MYKILRFFMFFFEPEKVHYRAMSFLRILFKISFLKCLIRRVYSVENKQLELVLCGMKISNPVGLAAGFDKNGSFIDLLEPFGFGFIEIGTVTPMAQSGNEKPRLFRLKKDHALINRMGFNNQGIKSVVQNLKKRKSNIIIGGNIGKNKNTSNENAISDYVTCFHELVDWVDYFAINVSSPNTPNLRALQERDALSNLLTELVRINRQKITPKPIFLKIAPDLNESQLDEIIEIVIQTGISGVIATNTTIERTNLKTSQKIIEQIGIGGLSGLPLKEKSTEVIRYISKKSNYAFPIIGVGGIHNEKDALEKLDAGASLVQLYTGFVYEGPGIVKRINRSILKKKNERTTVKN